MYRREPSEQIANPPDRQPALAQPRERLARRLRPSDSPHCVLQHHRLEAMLVCGEGRRIDAVVGRDADDVDARNAVRAQVVGERRLLVLGGIRLRVVGRSKGGVGVNLEADALRASAPPVIALNAPFGRCERACQTP